MSTLNGDAEAAVENLIRERGLDNVDVVAIDNCLHEYGICGKDVKTLLLQVWHHAVERFVATDGMLDSVEAVFLDRLKCVLGLDEKEANSGRDSVLTDEFLRRSVPLMSRSDATSEDTRSAISRLARQLRISPDQQKALLKPLAQTAFDSIRNNLIATRRAEVENLQAFRAFQNEYELSCDEFEVNKLVRCLHLRMLDQGMLPKNTVDVSLNTDEICHFAAGSILFEPRKVRTNGMTNDNLVEDKTRDVTLRKELIAANAANLQEIDRGALYITNKRVLFVGGSATKTMRFSNLTRTFADNCGLVIQRATGKNQHFVFNNDLDIEAAARILEDLCGAKKLSPVSDGLTTRTERSPLPSEAIEQSQSTKATAPSPKSTPAVQSLLKELDALAGLAAVKQEVRSLFSYLRVQALRLEKGLPTGPITTHLVFTGNPGTGKTTVARLLAKLYQAMGFLPGGQLVETDRSGLVAGYLGQTAIKTSEVVKKAIGGVLFIDEAYALAHGEHGGSNSDSYGQEAIDTLVKAMEDNRDQLVVIVAGYTAPMQQFLTSNPGLQSRFTRFIDFPDYSPKELSQIFSDLVSRQGYSLADHALQHASDLLQQAYQRRSERFGNARLVRTMFERATVRLSDRLADDPDITSEELTTLRAEDIELPGTSTKSPRSLQSLLQELNALTGLDAVKHEVHSLINHLRIQRARAEKGLPSEQITTHLVFTGNPGTGKTTVARLLAELYQAIGFLPGGQLIETDRNGLVGEYLGQTAIKTSEVVKKALGGVLFIDEAYALTEQGINSSDAYGQEAINTLVKAMEDNHDRLVVIVAGYTAPMQKFLASNPGLQSRFTRFIEFPDYSPKELSQIFTDLTSRKGYTLADDALQHASDLLKQAYQNRSETFGNARLVRTMFERATVRLSNRLADDPDMTREELTTLRAEDIELPGTSTKSPSSLQSLLQELNALTGLDAVKHEVQSLINHLRIQRARAEKGLPSEQITTHLVFTGNPGTGKTTVARLLAKLYQAIGFLPGGQLIETDRSGLVGEYLGQTAIKTSEVVKKALGGVLFIDEAYALTEQGINSSDAYGQEAINTLVKAMEDNHDRLVVIVAGYTAPMQKFLTSNPGLQSRFTRFIRFPDYSPKELLQIFTDLTSRKGYTLADDALQHASDLLKQAYQNRSETFGNARLVRTMFERATVRLSNRLADDPDMTREELTTLHAEDIEVSREYLLTVEDPDAARDPTGDEVLVDSRER